MDFNVYIQERLLLTCFIIVILLILNMFVVNLDLCCRTLDTTNTWFFHSLLHGEPTLVLWKELDLLLILVSTMNTWQYLQVLALVK